MDESKHSLKRHEWDCKVVHDMQGSYWKRAHHEWRFRIVWLLMIAAMVIYQMIEDFGWLPHNRQFKVSPH